MHEAYFSDEEKQILIKEGKSKEHALISKSTKCCEEDHDPSNFQLLRNICYIWLPFSISEFLTSSPEVINLAVVTHLTDTKTAGIVSLAGMLINLFFDSVMLGMNSALETFAS